MKTKILTKNELNEASTILKNEGILAFPTETVFGLGVISNSEKACKNLIKVKKRHPDKPFTMMCSNISQVENILEINNIAKRIIEEFMPGPLTIILKAKNNIPSYLDLGTGYVGIRIPKDEAVLKLIDMVGVPLLVPSANPADMSPARNTQDVLNYFDGTIEGIIEGETKDMSPSTVIKIVENDIILLREGPISLERIKGVLQK